MSKSMKPLLKYSKDEKDVISAEKREKKKAKKLRRKEYLMKNVQTIEEDLQKISFTSVDGLLPQS